MKIFIKYFGISGDTEQYTKVRGGRLLRNHIKAMFLKLVYGTTRNKLQNFIQFISPVVNITLSVIISRSWKFLSDLRPLELSLKSGFKTTQTLASYEPGMSQQSIESKTMEAYKHYFRTSTYPNMNLVHLGNSSIGDHYLGLVSIVLFNRKPDYVS